MNEHFDYIFLKYQRVLIIEKIKKMQGKDGIFEAIATNLFKVFDCI